MKKRERNFVMIGVTLLIASLAGPTNLNGQTLKEVFGDSIDLANPPNYANQGSPSYIFRDNTPGFNPITNHQALLGRVLFYDKNLSVDNSISCSSCHKQELAFGDDAITSVGVNGTTSRHSMRLVNARYGEEANFFWDERAFGLELQVAQPIADPVEMGFSGQNGNPDFDDLITKLSAIEYYEPLFESAWGSSTITKQRMELSLAQFVRSIQSFDSKFDTGRAMVNNTQQAFPNFTATENQGKTLFLANPQFQGSQRVGGGVGCASCHQAAEFSIDTKSQNNGVTASADGVGVELDNSRSPSLRDLFNPSGKLNGPLMHNGNFSTFNDVLDHYNAPDDNPFMDVRMQPGGSPQRLNLTNVEREALTAFVQTLTGQLVYTDSKLASPFVVKEGFVAAASMSVFRGSQVDGDLKSVQSSDNESTEINSEVTLDSTEAPVWLIFDSTASDATEFVIESRSNTPGLTYTVEAFNWSTNQYDTIDARDESAFSDCSGSYSITADHVSSSGDVRSRVGWRATGFTLLFPWSALVDLAGWQ